MALNERYSLSAVPIVDIATARDRARTGDVDGAIELSRAAIDVKLVSGGTVNLSNSRAIFAGSPPRFTRSRVTYEAYVVSRTSTRPQVDSASAAAGAGRCFLSEHGR